MEKFTTLTGVAAPLDAANVDTDQIIPKQFLLAVDRKGFGVHLFHERRYLDDAETIENPDFVLNKPAYRSASILVARRNFGNGSSTRPGRCSTSASAPSSRRPSPTSSATTRSATGSCW